LKILGIDPGLVQTGFGIINIKNNNETKLIDYGIIKPSSNDTLSKRLLTIFNDMCEIINKYNPTIISIEEVFYGKNVNEKNNKRGNRLLKNLRTNLIMVFFGEIYALRLWFGGHWAGGSTLRRERGDNASMGA